MELNFAGQYIELLVQEVFMFILQYIEGSITYRSSFVKWILSGQKLENTFCRTYVCQSDNGEFIYLFEFHFIVTFVGNFANPETFWIQGEEKVETQFLQPVLLKQNGFYTKRKVQTVYNSCLWILIALKLKSILDSVQQLFMDTDSTQTKINSRQCTIVVYGYRQHSN